MTVVRFKPKQTENASPSLSVGMSLCEQDSIVLREIMRAFAKRHGVVELGQIMAPEFHQLLIWGSDKSEIVALTLRMSARRLDPFPRNKNASATDPAK
jgi:hypothetical protein